MVKFTENEGRQIGNPVKKGEGYIHPITLQFRQIDKNTLTVPTELYITKEGVIDVDKEIKDYKKLSKKELQIQMVLPTTVYNENYLLYLYNIFKVDDLNKFINNEISKDTLFKTINRVINIFIYYKFEEFKQNNSSLINIYKKIYNKYWKNYNVKDLDKVLKEYITNFLKKIDKEDYNFDLGNKLKKHLKHLK